ncbi:MAG TPA: LemA family protein [Candidatus Avimonoglobus intestinipullorum]|uniref:LemA family protein n=1 Tax=Candidatus Avimonoglobus intestinipullorum TaxID=2840699 RepID=A0A9D1LVK9_9FIRM|nr:LemA family protein [Candidatus Avimonoglobus intestinipullorum]
MKKGTKIGLIVLAAVVIVAVMIGTAYNGLVKKDEQVNTAYANIESQLQRRNDLIPNLVETVKGYAAHETEVFTAVTEARERMMAAQGPDAVAEADGELTQALGRLIAVAESYPELQANENFLSLQDELAGTENRINTARMDYNAAVQTYNASIRSFPTNILAGIFGFERREQFQAQEGAQEVPAVDFGGDAE